MKKSPPDTSSIVGGHFGAALAEGATSAATGALTVAELAVVGAASVLVPFPHAVDDHQTGNAR
ncbi:MAG TPA: glycosyltransferase, partial [Polyangiaceae bacterium]|nr:glycosyltransferase [Polyangiaceae bacterium]